MAVIEQDVKQEVVREISIPISREQEEALTRAASQTGQSLEEFAASALVRAAEAVLVPTDAHVQPSVKSFASVLGIFRDEPLMEALMERIHEERRIQMEQEAEAAE